VLTFIKPGVDAARVAAGNENADGLAAMDPLVELALMKIFEMCFESLPAAILQTRAFIISEEASKAALASIIISCCTTGFAAATMWFDWDVSPEKRKENPLLAGQTPDTGRGFFFFLLVLSGTLQVVAKSFSSALFFIVNPSYFLGYMAADHVVYQLYRVARRDHQNYYPGTSLALSVGMHVLTKMVADYTSCWLLRSPIMIPPTYVRASDAPEAARRSCRGECRGGRAKGEGGTPAFLS
jgi:hypothetical protein